MFDFGPVEGRAVVAAFDGRAMTSDAGALLLGATDRAIGLIDRFAACFHDERRADLIEHEVATLVGQRVFGIALGYEDLNDHDQLRHDPVLAVLAGKLRSAAARGLRAAGRQVDAEPAGAEPASSRRAITRSATTPAAIESAVRRSVPGGASRAPPKQIILDLDATDDPLHGASGGPLLPRLLRLLLLSAALRLLRPASAGRQAAARRTSMRAAGAVEEVARIVAPDPRAAGRGRASCCAPIAASPARR